METKIELIKKNGEKTKIFVNGIDISNKVLSISSNELASSKVTIELGNSKIEMKSNQIKVTTPNLQCRLGQ